MQRGPGRPSAYPAEFREEAVRLATSPDHTIGGVARDLGIKRDTLRGWISRSRREPQGLEPDERRELLELRRRVKTLEQEREILKKAAAFFARETERTQ
jgi:transposase